MFGCVVFARTHSKSKLDPRAIKCVFIGYSPTEKDYKCYDPSTNRVVINLNVTFFDNTLYYQTSFLQGENLKENNSFGHLGFYSSSVI